MQDHGHVEQFNSLLATFFNMRWSLMCLLIAQSCVIGTKKSKEVNYQCLRVVFERKWNDNQDY